ncbi:hypothetical protein DFH06DRAFT_1148074 [Mycena polygramma]|nr:hypothetical protein DFH06DRAFT_1148074 [Mycena polygramma]
MHGTRSAAIWGGRSDVTIGKPDVHGAATARRRSANDAVYMARGLRIGAEPKSFSVNSSAGGDAPHRLSTAYFKVRVRHDAPQRYILREGRERKGDDWVAVCTQRAKAKVGSCRLPQRRAVNATSRIQILPPDLDVSHLIWYGTSTLFCNTHTRRDLPVQFTNTSLRFLTSDFLLGGDFLAPALRSLFEIPPPRSTRPTVCDFVSMTATCARALARAWNRHGATGDQRA